MICDTGSVSAKPRSQFGGKRRGEAQLSVLSLGNANKQGWVRVAMSEGQHDACEGLLSSALCIPRRTSAMGKLES